MSYEDLKNEFEKNNKLHFKLYSLEYLIEQVDNNIQIYAIDYPTMESKYNSFEELMNNYTVYNEKLIEIVNNIIIINNWSDNNE